MAELTAAEFKEHLKVISKLSDPIAVLAVGKPATGKTFTVKEVASETGRQYYVLCLSRIEQFDFKGFPAIKGDYVRWIPTDLVEFILKHDGNVIIHLDEFTIAKKELQDAVLDFLQFKKIDNIELPKRTMIVLTGNQGGDGTNARSVSAALTTGRAECFKIVQPKVQEYIKYERGLVPKFIQFLTTVGLEGLVQPPDPNNPFAPVSCARSWSRLNEIVKELRLDLDTKQGLAAMFTHASGLLSEDTVLQMHEFFDGNAVSVTELSKCNEAEWARYAGREAYTRQQLALALARTITGSSAAAQKVVNMLAKYEKEMEIAYTFISELVEDKPELLEKLTWKDTLLVNKFDDFLSKKYALATPAPGKAKRKKV